LLSNDLEERHSAAVWFVENAPENDLEKAEVTGPLAELLGTLSPKVHHLALRALKKWGTKDCLPQVVAFGERQQKAGNNKEAAANNPALIDLLSQFPDQTAADAVAIWLRDPERRGLAVQALLKIGPAATASILTYLNHPDADVRKEARSLCNLLKVPTERQIGQTLADVADTRKARSRAALQHLAQLRPDEASRVKVSQALNAPLLDTDAEIREGALDAVRIWATRENIDTLLKLLGNLASEGKKESGRNIDRVSEVLIAIGPDVEEAVIPLLKSPLVPVRGEACRVLGEVGTKKSVAALQDAGKAWLPVDPSFCNYTDLAVAKIVARK
jgi:HEAT repeat protein